MATLLQVASRIQDLYEQNYVSNDQFLEIEDFKYWVTTNYSSMLNALMQAQRVELKKMEGFSNIELPAQWLIEEELEIKFNAEAAKYYVTTSQPVFAFDFDNFSYAVQDLEGVGCSGQCRYKKISLNEKKYMHLTPPTSDIFYCLNNKKEFVFWGAKEGNKVRPRYIPQIVGQDDDCLLSDNIIQPLSEELLKQMFMAKNGNFIDKINDQNPNVAPGQQVTPVAGGR